jgi:hypothetical protein
MFQASPTIASDVWRCASPFRAQIIVNAFVERLDLRLWRNGRALFASSLDWIDAA